jgi:hypothetical protein
MILTIVLLLASTQASSSPLSAPPASEQCYYDPKNLTLGLDAFDQDMTGGWRALSMKAGCEEAAADMVRAYRMNYENYIPLLYWHEAQLRASAGDYSAAIPLMLKSRQPVDRDEYGWNAYADATIAFLRNDKKALLKARGQLANLAKPAAVRPERKWPPNLDVVDGLIRCFGKSYKVAYGPTCRARNVR